MKDGILSLERKPTEKKEMISIGGDLPPTITVTPSTSVEKGTFQIIETQPIVTPIQETLPQTKPLKLDGEVKLAKKEVSLELGGSIVVSDSPLIGELVKIRAQEIEAISPSLSGGKEEEELPEFFELAYGKGGGRIRATGLKVILFKDSFGSSYVNLLEELCLRIYREREGGEPKARKISTYDEFWKREVEKWLDPSHRIITIDLDYKNGKYWKDLNDSDLKDRLDELYAGQIGFIIFRTADDRMLGEYTRKLESINKASNYRLNIIELTAQALPESFANLIWGNALESVPLGKFDEIFNKAMKKFVERLDAIKGEEMGLFKSATNRNKGQIKDKKAESDLHYDIKVFLVSYLVRRLRRERGLSLRTPDEVMKHIRTEEDTASPVPDVQEDSEVYEVETLFGEGENADKKIDETILKYDLPNIGIRRVNIVMDNLGYLMHIKDLERIEKSIENKSFGVEFYALDLTNIGLIPLSEIKKQVRDIVSEG